VQFGSPNIPKLAQCVAVVAVLQFQNRLYDSQKLTLYLYINIEVFLGYGNSFKRTATLQHCNSFLSRYSGMKKLSQKNEKFLVKYS
jgi:hypothetical protein